MKHVDSNRLDLHYIQLDSSPLHCVALLSLSLSPLIQELKRRLNKTKEAEHTRLTVLSSESDKCMKALADKVRA